jgi:D-alanyl-D-alanine carboxypeptidase
LDDIVTISKDAAAASFAFDEQVCGLKEGDQLTLEALINGLLIWSGNDAAVAIAEHVGGSIEDFASMMNQKAKDLHAVNTHFVTPNGLHDKDHYTTAYDLYLIFNECIQHEEFVEIISSKSYKAEITDINGKVREKKWDSTSFYAREIVPDPDGGDVIGGKTGYTSEAGNCLILLNEDENGRQFISIVMGAKDKPLLYEDMTAIINQIPNT